MSVLAVQPSDKKCPVAKSHSLPTAVSISSSFAYDSRVPSRSSSSSSTPLSSDGAQEAVINTHFIASHQAAQGRPTFLPPNILQKVLQHSGSAELQALHQVNAAWRDAVCEGLRTVAPSTCDAALLKRFPGVEVIGLENITFTAAQPTLAGLVRLRTLVLHDCTFEHPICSLTTLTALEKVKLREVKALGQPDMDALLERLPNLTSLEVTRVSGQRTLPTLSKLSSLQGLHELIISDAHHRERMTSLTQLSALDKLQKLSLTKVRVDCNVVSAISRLTDLHTLELPDCYKVTDQALPSLSPLTGLTKLDIRSLSHRREEDLTDAGIQHLSALTNLKIFNFAGHRSVTSAGLDFISSFTSITDLSLAGVPLWTGGAGFLAALSQLSGLNLARTHLAADQLCVLGSLSALKALNISEASLGQDAAVHLSRMSSLETLDVSYCPMGNAELVTIAAGCPNLVYMNLDGCWISTLCMLGVVRRRPTLRLWHTATSSLPLFMYKVDAVLVAQTTHHTRRLRVLHQGEGSVLMTSAVLLGVLSFFLFYFTILFVIFTAVFLFPLCLLGVLCLLVGVFAMSARVTSGTAKCLFNVLTGSGSLCCLASPEAAGQYRAGQVQPEDDAIINAAVNMV